MWTTQQVTLNINQSIPILSHECYYHQMTSETTVTINTHDEKQDLDMIIPTFAVLTMLMQRCKTLIDDSSLGTSLLS